MIEVNLMDACQKCPHLEAKSNYLYDITTIGTSEPYQEITCEHIEKCRTLLEHLEKEIIKNG